MAILQRALAAADLTSSIYYTDTVQDTYKNDFDLKKPWSDIKEVTDSFGNVWIQIPKFYTKYVMDETNTYIKERYISEFNGGNGWHLNPLFKNQSGKELDSVLISKYLITENSGRAYSQSGYAPYSEVTATTARALIDSYDAIDTEGYEYSSFDIWALIALQDLSIIEFANSNLHSIMQGITYANYRSGKNVSGTTDNVGQPTSSGVAAKQDNDSGLFAMKYRGIENVWGNGRLFVDGIYIENYKIYVCSDAHLYGSYDKYSVANLNIANQTGFVHRLGFDPATCLVYPVAVQSNGSYGDYCNAPSDKSRALCYLGAESNNGGQIGLSSFILSGTNSSLPHTVFRMIKKQK